LASNSERRVVVTGIGLICSVGNTTDAVWQALLAGKSGVSRITGFDASAFACQIAAEVRNFDPFQFIEKKEVKKMGRFIHFAIAASDEAMKMSQLQVTPDIAENVGVHIGSGIGGFDVIEREHNDLAFLHSCRHRQPRRRARFHAVRRQGPQ
jgi:3-oxoacyl-[acyl-carrier-protein] synthase II